jgi:hypothetical protein
MLPYTKYLEPRINVVEATGKSKIVAVGGKFVFPKKEQSSNYGTINQAPQQVSLVIQPSTGTIIDRHMKMRYFIEVTTDQAMKLGLTDGPRQCPLNSVIQSTKVDINRQAVNDNTIDGLHALLSYGSANDPNRRISTTPYQSDQFQDYGDYVPLGTGRNVFAKYGETGAQPSRGGFPFEVVTGNDTEATKIRYVVTEPLFISPLLHGEVDDEGLVNVSQLDINITFSTNLSRFMSHDSITGNAITSVAVVQYQAPELIYTTIAPQDWQVMPPLQVLDYVKLDKQPNQLGILTPGEKRRVSSTTFRLNQIPNRMWVFVAKNKNTATFSDSDSFCTIDNLDITYNTNSGILNNASQQDLYEMSVRNGLQESWPAFSKYRGSVVCASFASDIGQQSGEAPGVIAVTTVKVDLNITNESKVNFDAVLWCVFEMNGTITIVPGSASTNLGNMSESDALVAKMSPNSISHEHYKRLSGGSFWSTIKSIISGVAPVVSAIAPVAAMGASVFAPELVPGISAAGCVAKALQGKGLGLKKRGVRRM